ncbi:MAG: M1 family aminopeptidase [Zavarzinella sp.]
MRIVGIVCLFATLPISGADLQPPKWLPKYQLAINLDVAGHRAYVAQQVSWTNRTGKPLSEIVFNVHSHFAPPKSEEAYRQFGRLLEIVRVPGKEAIFKEPAFQLSKVERINVVDDQTTRKELKHQWNEQLATALMVALDEPLPDGQTVILSLEYQIELPQKKGRWGQWDGVTYLSNWHPVVAKYLEEGGWAPTPFIPWHQPFYNEAGEFTVQIQLPENEKVACTGSIANEVSTVDGKLVSIGPVVARDFSFMTSARYQEFRTEADNAGKKVVVKCLAFPEHEHYANVLVGQAAKALEAYARWIGPYPYAELTIAETFFGWNGNECCGLIMIDERVFTMPKLAEKYVQYLISHETCHQWFYNVIGTDGYRETFMDEAMVTFLAHRFLDELEGKNNELLNYPQEIFFLPGIKRENYRYTQFYNVHRNGGLQPAVQQMEKYGNVVGLFASVYDRGSKIMMMIEERIGKMAFNELLRRIYKKYYFQTITVAQFQKELEEYTGRSWKNFFAEWLTTAGVTDWAVDQVQVNQAADQPENGPVTVTVELSQRAEITEDTILGISFDDETYPLKVPIRIPQQYRTFSDGSGQAVVGEEVKQPGIEFLDKKRVRIELELPQKPAQIMVDPDLIVPDADPVNNRWHTPVANRPRPITTFLDESALTNDYDKWNLIYGPWLFGTPYGESWFTRSSVVGVRGSAYKLEEFKGGIYTGYRPNFGDLAIGVDGQLLHQPWPKSEIGFFAEKSLTRFLAREEFRPDRAAVWLRQNIEQTSSLYLYPREFVDIYAAYQNDFLPPPRNPNMSGVAVDPLTTVGLHYRKETLMPYWNPDDGYSIDGNVAMGLPLFGENRVSGLAWGQANVVVSPFDGISWWEDVKVAAKVFGGVAFPQNGRFFSLGGNVLFRGYDNSERQGSSMWLGSVEVRLPVVPRLNWNIVDNVVRVESIYVAPFYDIGDIYVDGHSMGPVAHAAGLSFQFNVEFFSFLERGTLKLDVARAFQSIDNATQFWVTILVPY